MPRPEKNTVDYFQHDCVPKKTLYIIEQKHGNDGYAFWYKLLEILGSTDGHYLDLNNQSNMEFLTSKTRCDEDFCRKVLDLLCRLEAIDCGLWHKGVIWCQNFVDRIKHVYDKRTGEAPVRPTLEHFKNKKNNINGTKRTKTRVSDPGNHK